MAFNIDELLTKAHKVQASDIHINCNKVPSLRINGEIFKIQTDVITQNDVQSIIDKTLPKEYKQTLAIAKDIDYTYEIKGLSRYRVNYCKDIHFGKLTFRAIPYNIKTLEELSLPPYLKEFTNCLNGIVFMTGATGSGKTTTLASLIEIINQKYKRHIITIEDPVEFVYEDKKSIITQRSLDLDVRDFKTGIKYALRQDPDVILLGEIRDKETLLTAIEASETGHLVFSTLHTNGTVSSIDRMRGFFDEAAQDQVMRRLAHCVRGIAHQQLVPTVQKGRLVPAIEILTFTSTVVDYVKQGKLHEITQLMQRSRQPNIVTMNMALYELYKKELITKETALAHSLEKVEMEQMLKGVTRNAQTDEPLL